MSDDIDYKEKVFDMLHERTFGVVGVLTTDYGTKSGVVVEITLSNSCLRTSGEFSGPDRWLKAYQFIMDNQTKTV